MFTLTPGRALDGDPARATALIRSAAECLATSPAPLSQRELARANQWLRDHGSTP